MIFHILDFTVTADAVTPDTPQFAGHAGDHRAVLLRFTVPFEACRYRLEIVDGGGGYDITALLDAVDGIVSYEIPSSWTSAGVATVRLVAVEESVDGTETVRFHFAPVYLNFSDREEGEQTGQTARPAWQETLDEAQFFLKAVEQKLENGELNGKKGDKGDNGYTPQKGVDYYTDAEKQELIAELGARDVDQTLDPDSTNAIANKVVAARFNQIEGHLGGVDSDLACALSDSERALRRLDEDEKLLNQIHGSIGGIESDLACALSDSERALRRLDEDEKLLNQLHGRIDDIGSELFVALADGERANSRLDMVEGQLEGVEEALDGILAIQQALIGGDGA